MSTPRQAVAAPWAEPSHLDRAEDRRGDPGWVAEQWADPLARVLAVSATGRVAWSGDGLRYTSPSGGLGDAHVLLGLVSGAPVFAELALEPGDSVVLRAVMDELDVPDLQVAFTAVALAAWHESAMFCGWCGTATTPERGGVVRRCGGCQRELYPRVDPAMIVAVTDADDRILLGRQPVWEPRRMSVFAGFVSAGESLEQAVHREVFEEVGLHLSQVSYVSSQAWPFPRSLMVAFSARAGHTDLTVDTTEIEQAAWFSRQELDAALAAGEVRLPMTTSVAHRMITAWRDGLL